MDIQQTQNTSKSGNHRSGKLNSRHKNKAIVSAPYGYLDYFAGRWHTRKKHANKQNQSQTALAYPEPRKRLIKELSLSTPLGSTADGKQIYLFDYRINSSVIREIGRLRELTFREVGEGTFKNRDIDKFDKRYRHIVLWDTEALEIIGAYRIGEAFKMSSTDTLYTASLFHYQEKFSDVLPYAIELGRSFIQPQYWNKRGLDYLWNGIGAYLAIHPHVRYLFGAVSISNDYPLLAKQQIAAHYKHAYQPDDWADYAIAKHPFHSERSILESCRDLTIEQSQRHLKQALKQQKITLPTLYKHYADLCTANGVRFIDFNIDPEFSYCLDGLIINDLAYIKANKQQRYITSNQRP